jgi:hypothetical protein
MQQYEVACKVKSLFSDTGTFNESELGHDYRKLHSTHNSSVMLTMPSDITITIAQHTLLPVAEYPWTLYNHVQVVFHGELNTKPVVRNSGVLPKSYSLATIWPYGIHNFSEKKKSKNVLEFYLPFDIF